MQASESEDEDEEARPPLQKATKSEDSIPEEGKATVNRPIEVLEEEKLDADAAKVPNVATAAPPQASEGKRTSLRDRMNRKAGKG